MPPPAGVATPPPAVVATPAQGAAAPDGVAAPSRNHPFRIGVADREGKEIGPDSNGFSDPSDRQARNLVFDIDLSLSENGPTTTEMALYCELGKLEHTLNELYPASDPASEAKFRPHFVRLFYLSQLVLEGDPTRDSNGRKKSGNRLSVDAAKAEIASIGEDLINDEAPRIKNGHLRELAKQAGKFLVPFLLAYVVLTLFASSKNSEFLAYLTRLHIDAGVAANFMLLWVGTLVGVCLSYALRTHEVSVSDLTRTDDDHLSPEIRLLLTGALATLLMLIALIGLGDVTIGGYSISNIDHNPTLAVVLGAIFGISEQKLSKTVLKRVENLFGGATK